MAKRVLKATKTVTQIKDEIRKLKEELKSKTKLKPFVINLEVHITPEYNLYISEEYEAKITKIVCKENQKIANMAYDHIDPQLCRNFLVTYFGEDVVLIAEEVIRGGNNE